MEQQLNIKYELISKDILNEVSRTIVDVSNQLSIYMSNEVGTESDECIKLKYLLNGAYEMIEINRYQCNVRPASEE